MDTKSKASYVIGCSQKWHAHLSGCFSQRFGTDFPAYLKRDLSLYGTAEEIYLRANKVIETMIAEVVNNQPVPVDEPVAFKRRTPEQTNLAQVITLEQELDYIRMLDAESYLPAFIEKETLRLEPSRAALKCDGIEADVRITMKNTLLESLND